MANEALNQFLQDLQASSVDPPPAQQQPPPQGEKSRKRSTAVEKARKDGVNLYIDCAPIGSQYRDKLSMPKYEDVSGRIARINKHIAETYKVPHWTAMDYGKGRGIFIAALEHDLIVNVPSVPLYVSTDSTDNKEALAVLMANSKSVFRSTK